VYRRTGRFVGDGTPEEAPRPAARTAAAAARDAHRRPARRRDDPLLRKPFLALACPGNRSGRGRPGDRRVAGRREAGACSDGGGDRRQSFLRARDRTRRGQTDSAEATRRSYGVRNDHARTGDRPARFPRAPRAPACRDLARVRRLDRPRDHARGAAFVQPHFRARTGRPHACDRLAGHACARRAADCLRPVLHASLCRHGRAPRVGFRLCPRHLAAAVPRRRAPL